MDIKAKLNTTPVKMTELEDGNFEFSGYASTFNSEPDSYGDIIAPGAFKDSITNWVKKDTPLPILFNHNWDKVIGHFTELKEDHNGLYVKGVLISGVQQASEVIKLLQSGTLGSLSIGYMLEKFNDNADGTYLLEEIGLLEVSIVVIPANELALIDKVKCKTANKQDVQIKDYERLIRDVASVSNKEAKTTISGLKQRDVEQQQLKQMSRILDQLIGN